MANKGDMGCINKSGDFSKTGPRNLAASVIFSRLGGKFMTNSGGSHSLSVAGDTQIEGWADVAGGWTSSATAAAETVVLIDDLSAVFELPVAAACTALTAANLLDLLGDTCDLVIESDAQMADIDSSSTDVVKIVGGDVDRNVVYVKINPAKFYTRGVA